MRADDLLAKVDAKADLMADNPNLRLFVRKQTILSQNEDPFPMDFNEWKQMIETL